jgi:DNA repair photolyase
MRTKLEHFSGMCYDSEMKPQTPQKPDKHPVHGYGRRQNIYQEPVRKEDSNEAEIIAARKNIRGRGALDNPAGRFERLVAEDDPEAFDLEDIVDGKQVKTEVFIDKTKSIVSTNDSPDVGMEASVNPYRGCEHGCIYCFARPTHEYFGLSAGLDFETKIFAKPEAPRLLAEKLSSKSWEPKVLMLSGVTDCYQPIEKKLKITRGCFEVLLDFRNPAAIVTKNILVTRDIDIFQEMAKHNLIKINISLTTLDNDLARYMEPRASKPLQKLRAIEAMAKAGVPVGIMMGPIVPGLTDHEIPKVLEAAANAGAETAYHTVLRLPWGVKDLFENWVHEHYPDRADRILNRVKAIRGGKLYESDFETRMSGTGIFADQIHQMFTMYKKKYGLNKRGTILRTDGFKRDARSAQMSLF